ncbi:MAG: hypothetical protein KDI39_15400, partial [Pseudomonadales bacterium]|nr:hypothetical protein [Pseudomonadales bacterium]
ILNARVALKNAKTGATLAATKTLTPSSNGTATFTVPITQLADPILAEVLPTTAGIVEYFDEALEDNKIINVPVADIAKPILRAAASVTANANIGVTGLTEAAVQQAEKQAGGLIAQNINNANAAVKNALKLNFDVTQAPVVVGKGEFEKLINASLNTALEAQRKAYATYLATLAKEAQRINSASVNPAYDMAKAFANDFAHDGVFNGVGSQALAINYTNTFLTNWFNWVQNFYSSFVQLSNIVAFNRWYGGFNIADKNSVTTYPDAVPIRTIDGVEEYACSGEGRIKSSSGASIYMDFVNQRGSNINVYWLNSNGSRVTYKTNLLNTQTHNQQTFVTHPWLITDNTGTCIAIYRPVTATKKTITFKSNEVMIGTGTPVEEAKTPATVNSGLVKSYALKYNLSQNGGGYTNGQTLTAIVSNAGDLVIGGFAIKNPYYDKVNGIDFKGEVIWKDGNIKYALSNNTTGVFNEINVFDTNKTNPFLGQFVLETPVTTNDCTSTGADNKLGFANAPSDFCSFTKSVSAMTPNPTLARDIYTFDSANGETVTITVGQNTLISVSVQKGDKYAYACGVADTVACKNTVFSNQTSYKEFSFANTELTAIKGTNQNLTLKNGSVIYQVPVNTAKINLAACSISSSSQGLQCGAQVSPDFNVTLDNAINSGSACSIVKSGNQLVAESGAVFVTATLDNEDEDIASKVGNGGGFTAHSVKNGDKFSITVTYFDTGLISSVLVAKNE